VKPVLLDSGVIVALLDGGDQFHRACVDAVGSIETPLVTCEAVIAESCHLLRHVQGAREAILKNVAAGIFRIAFQLSRDAEAVRALLRKYDDQQIDLADACLIVLANEFETADILTVDRDFCVYRWGRNKRFRIVPGDPAELG